MMITPYTAWQQAFEHPKCLHPKFIFGRRFDGMLTEAIATQYHLILVDLVVATAPDRGSGVSDRLTQLFRAARRTSPNVHMLLVGPPHKSWQSVQVKQLVHELTMTFSTHAWCGLLPRNVFEGHPTSRRYTIASTCALADTLCRGCSTHGTSSMEGAIRSMYETKAIAAVCALAETLQHPAPHVLHAAMTEPDSQAPNPKATDSADSHPTQQSGFFSADYYAARQCWCGDRDCHDCSRYFITHDSTPPESSVAASMSDTLPPSARIVPGRTCAFLHTVHTVILCHLVPGRTCAFLDTARGATLLKKQTNFQCGFL
eukprot:785004-Amphidinium_carterae.2